MKSHSHFETFLVFLFTFLLGYLCSQADNKLRERIEVLEEVTLSLQECVKTLQDYQLIEIEVMRLHEKGEEVLK